MQKAVELQSPGLVSEQAAPAQERSSKNSLQICTVHVLPSQILQCWLLSLRLAVRNLQAHLLLQLPHTLSLAQVLPVSHLLARQVGVLV